MEKRKDIFGAFLASSVNTLEEILVNGQSNDLTIEDLGGVYYDMFAFARIYMAFMANDLSLLDEDDLKMLNRTESWIFTHPEESKEFLGE